MQCDKSQVSMTFILSLKLLQSQFKVKIIFCKSVLFTHFISNEFMNVQLHIIPGKLHCYCSSRWWQTPPTLPQRQQCNNDDAYIECFRCVLYTSSPPKSLSWQKHAKGYWTDLELLYFILSTLVIKAEQQDFIRASSLHNSFEIITCQGMLGVSILVLGDISMGIARI